MRPTLRTPRLELVAADAESAGFAAAQDHAALGRVLDARVPDAWPDPVLADALAPTAAQIREDPGLVGWSMWFVVLREPLPRTLVGCGGYKGPPGRVGGPGTVEIGYSILPEFQRRGLGSEAAGALVSRAFEDSTLHRVIAHTFALHEPSLGVLQRCGFEFAGPGFETVDENDRQGRGELVLWQITRSRWRGLAEHPDQGDEHPPRYQTSYK